MNIPQIPMINLFPLTKLHFGTYLEGYYMDADCHIWSTRGTTPKMLKGSKTPSGRYYVLNKTSYRADNLQLKARAHKDFAKDTGTTAQATPVRGAVAKGGLPVALPGRTVSAVEAASKKGFILATMSSKGKLVFGTDPVFHLSETSAKAEAERVAGISGAQIVVLQIVGKVKIQKAVWE